VRSSWCRARRDDEEWSFHSEEKKRSHAPRWACNTARSGVTKQVKGENIKKFFSGMKLIHQTSGQLPDLGL